MDTGYRLQRYAKPHEPGNFAHSSRID